MTRLIRATSDPDDSPIEAAKAIFGLLWRSRAGSAIVEMDTTVPPTAGSAVVAAAEALRTSANNVRRSRNWVEFPVSGAAPLLELLAKVLPYCAYCDFLNAADRSPLLQASDGLWTFRATLSEAELGQATAVDAVGRALESGQLQVVTDDVA